MRSLVKLLGILIVTLTVSLMCALIVSYFVVGSDHSVPATVREDSGLPRIELSDIALHALKRDIVQIKRRAMDQSSHAMAPGQKLLDEISSKKARGPSHQYVGGLGLQDPGAGG